MQIYSALSIIFVLAAFSHAEQNDRTEYNPTTAQTPFPVEGPAPEDECSCEYTLDDVHIIAHTDGKLVRSHDRVKNGSTLMFRCAKIGYHRFVGVKELQCENCQFQNISETPSCIRPERGDAMIFLNKTANVSLEGILEVHKFKPLRLVCLAIEAAEFPVWNVPNVARVNLTEETVKRSKDAHLFLSHLEIDTVMPEDAGLYTCAPDKAEGRPAVVQVQVLDDDPFNPTTASSMLITKTSLNGFFSGKIKDFSAGRSNIAKSTASTLEDFPSKQFDDCTCTAFRPDSNRLVNGVKSQYGIRVQKGQIAVLQCIDPRMDLVFKNGAVTSKSLILECNHCRKYDFEEIPFCQDSRQETS